ncbi:PREDICTED: uncharacterized protein LOC108560709 [Nicrophorus vespilloides]|uniref:Uncharacterized protein LOC108560709 n=1 Tax=Nicrophorus vespilloides TaxID=110193 RepID=A0ABM1MH14_NICVS|nr:PREDICTED: uncharacterized protein LOC108560709 [Nicrophorus vespilloides]
MSSINKAHTVQLLNPLFNWGPPDLEMRKARKMYAPRTSIRSEPPKKKKIRWRMGSLRKLHDMDSMSGKSKGYIFMDSSFFTNISNLKMSPPRNKNIKVQKLLI